MASDKYTDIVLYDIKVLYSYSNHEAQQYLDDTLDVTMSLSIINGPQTCFSLPVLGVGFEDATRALTLTPNHASHFPAPEKY